MYQVRHQLRFTHKVLNEHFLAGKVWPDDLDRNALDEVVRAALLGLVHNPHPALKNFADDVVAKVVLDAE